VPEPSPVRQASFTAGFFVLLRSRSPKCKKAITLADDGLRFLFGSCLHHPLTTCGNIIPFDTLVPLLGASFFLGEDATARIRHQAIVRSQVKSCARRLNEAVTKALAEASTINAIFCNKSSRL